MIMGVLDDDDKSVGDDGDALKGDVGDLSRCFCPSPAQHSSSQGPHQVPIRSSQPHIVDLVLRHLRENVPTGQLRCGPKVQREVVTGWCWWWCRNEDKRCPPQGRPTRPGQA